MKTQPVSIYVLWHPAADELGRLVGSEIFRWFRLPEGDGIPVFFRSAAAPGRKDGRPLDLPPPGDGMQWIVPLVDFNMVADPVWREWLEEVAGSGDDPRRRMFPYALDFTAYSAPAGLRKLNFLRPPASPPEAEVSAGERARLLTPRLLKDLTEAFCRVITGPEGSLDVPAKVKVFLSHAKADGVEEARSLRDHLYRETQLSAFFDENDIALGYDFAGILEAALRPEETAALLIMHSDQYPSRPWCRREVLAFRRPLRLVRGRSEVWRLNPILVVQAMRGPGLGRTIAELGTVPCLRWEAGRESTLVTTLLREILFEAYHRILGRAIPRAEGRAVINWRPDIPSLVRLQVERGTDDGPLVEVVYPHVSMPRLELDALQTYFPRLTFRTFVETLAT